MDYLSKMDDHFGLASDWQGLDLPDEWFLGGVSDFTPALAGLCVPRSGFASLLVCAPITRHQPAVPYLCRPRNYCCCERRLSGSIFALEQPHLWGPAG